MTHEEVKALVEEMGLPYAYDHFAEGESPDPTVRPPSRYQTGVLRCANGDFSCD